MAYLRVLSLLLLVCSSQAQITYFVNVNVSGGLNNGSSWENAFSNLQSALSSANGGDIIWVAKGTYYPTSTDDRTISFELKQGIKIYGGFVGVETSIDQRNWDTNKSILSGDIGILNNSSDNTYHIIHCVGVDSTTILDGFYITKSMADGAGSNAYGGGIFLEPSSAILTTSPIIQNCTFISNTARIGAGLYCRWNNPFLVNPILTGCRFESNKALNSGGAIYMGSPANSNKDFIIEDCIFLNNIAVAGDGGGIFLTNSGHKAILRRCVFEKDSSKFSWGGAIFYSGFANPAKGGDLIIDSCIFNNCYAPEGAGLCFIDFFGSDGGFNLSINNSYFENNIASSGEGGGIFITGFEDLKVDAQINKSYFIGNQTRSIGMINIGADSSNLIISNSYFLNNKGYNSTSDGTHFAVRSSGYYSRTDVKNCVFAYNSASLSFPTTESGNYISQITNCTFFKNNKYIVEKTWYPSFFMSNQFRNDCFIENTIFIEPSTSSLKMFTNYNDPEENMYGYFINYSLLNLTDFFIPGAPEAFGDNVIFGQTDSIFSNVTNNSFSIHLCAPAVNAGNNLATINAGLLYDIVGGQRIVGNTVDIGAYETQDSCYVSKIMFHSSQLEDINLFPNPTMPNEKITVNFSGKPVQILNYTLLDINGVIKEIKFEPTNIHSYLTLLSPEHSGLFLLKIHTPNQIYLIKLVVL